MVNPRQLHTIIRFEFMPCTDHSQMFILSCTDGTQFDGELTREVALKLYRSLGAILREQAPPSHR